MASATSGLRAAQDQFAGAAAQIAQQGAAGEHTAASQNEAAASGSADLPGALVEQRLAAHGVRVNVKLLQAFDDMLSETLQIKR
jgi:hypothetical protein